MANYQAMGQPHQFLDLGGGFDGDNFPSRTAYGIEFIARGGGV